MSNHQIRQKQKLKLSIPMYNSTFSSPFSANSNNPGESNLFQNSHLVSKSKEFSNTTKGIYPVTRSSKKRATLPEMPYIYKQNSNINNNPIRPLSINKTTYSPLNLNTALINGSSTTTNYNRNKKLIKEENNKGNSGGNISNSNLNGNNVNVNKKNNFNNSNKERSSTNSQFNLTNYATNNNIRESNNFSLSTNNYSNNKTGLNYKTGHNALSNSHNSSGNNYKFKHDAAVLSSIPSTNPLFKSNDHKHREKNSSLSNTNNNNFHNHHNKETPNSNSHSNNNSNSNHHTSVTKHSKLSPLSNTNHTNFKLNDKGLISCNSNVNINLPKEHISTSNKKPSNSNKRINEISNIINYNSNTNSNNKNNNNQKNNDNSILTKTKYNFSESLSPPQVKSNFPSTTKNQPISIMSLFASNLPLDIKHLNNFYPSYDSSKYSAKSLGVVKSYSANTHQGTVRDYNEDRVSIILNIIKPTSYTGSFWPKCSFFGIYDGHGGSGCAEFLRDNLHHYVVRDENFPVNPKEALIKGFKAAETEFISKYSLSHSGYEIKDKSGSCANVILVVDDVIYIANSGDSRSVLSKNKGKEIIQLSRDHKPDDPEEKKRIISAGGKIYQTQTNTKNISPISLNMFNLKVGQNQILSGPSRVFPGRLSVCRSFGDVEAKSEKHGGNPLVIIAEPEVQMLRLSDDYDFIVMGCDGIFDQIKNEDIVSCAWMTTEKPLLNELNVHNQSGLVLDMIMKTALARKALDNITCVFIGFENWERFVKHMVEKYSSNHNNHNNHSYNSNSHSLQANHNTHQGNNLNKTSGRLHSSSANDNNNTKVLSKNPSAKIIGI